MTASLLLRHVEVGGRVTKLVIKAGFGGLTVSRDGHSEDADHLAVALVSFLQRVRTLHLHRNAGRARIALKRRVGAIQFGCVRLAGWIGHSDLVAIDFVSPDSGIVRQAFNLGSSPRTGYGMRSRRAFRYARR